MKIPNELICQKIHYLFLKFNLSGINEARNIHYCIDFRCQVSGQFYLCCAKSLNWQREFPGLHLFLIHDLNYSLGNTCNTYNVILLNLNCVLFVSFFIFYLHSPRPNLISRSRSSPHHNQHFIQCFVSDARFLI